MLPDRVLNPGPLTYESSALPIALRGPACNEWSYLSFKMALSAACLLLAGLGSAVGSASCSTARGPWVRYQSSP